MGPGRREHRHPSPLCRPFRGPPEEAQVSTQSTEAIGVGQAPCVEGELGVTPRIGAQIGLWLVVARTVSEGAWPAAATVEVKQVWSDLRPHALCSLHAMG